MRCSAASSIASTTRYRLVDQWTSYGWNVFVVDDGNDYDQVVASLNTLEHWDPKDRRPMVVIGKTIKGYWPAAKNGKITDECDQVVGYKSHPYGLKMNSDYFLPLACSLRELVRREVRGHPARGR